MVAEEESGTAFVREGMRIRSEVVRPILERAAKSFSSSWPSAKATVVKLPGPALGLQIELEGERRQLIFSFDVTPRRVKVSYTDARDETHPLCDPLSLSEVTADRVQSCVDEFFRLVAPT
jgi:hypothetical protein